MARLYTNSGFYSRRNGRGRVSGGITNGGGMGQVSLMGPRRYSLYGVGGLGACTWQDSTGWHYCDDSDAGCISAHCPGVTPVVNCPPGYTEDAFGQCVNPTNPIAAAITAAQTGQITPAQAQAFITATGSTYCSQNQQDHNVFGSPLDPNCAPGGTLPTGVTNGIVSAAPVNSNPVPPPSPTQPTKTITPPSTGNPLNNTNAGSSNNGLNTGNTTQGGATNNPPAEDNSGLWIAAAVAGLALMFFMSEKK